MKNYVKQRSMKNKRIEMMLKMLIRGDDHIKHNIGFIVPDEQVKCRMETLLEGEVKNKNLIVETLKQNEILNQAKSLINKGVSAIIARGGTYNDLKDNLNIPVINLRISTVDILQALNKAKKLSDKIYLVLQESIFFDYKEWDELLNIDIKILTFSRIEEIEKIVLEIKSMEQDAALVGGIITTQKGEEHGMKTILIRNTDDSIIETYKGSKELVKNIKNEKKKLKEVTAILNNIDDAVLVVNNKGEIEHLNNQAKKFLKRSGKNNFKVSILHIVPEIEFIFEVLKDKIVSNHILKINNLTLNVNAVPLDVDGEKIGIVCVLQDITKMQDLEKKLRYKLNKKGLRAKYTFDDIISTDDLMKEVIEDAKEFAMKDSTILIYGESGTGKEMFAQSIHNWSNRKNSPFVAVNCAALTDTSLESELFGYEEGAFTGARKGGKQGLFEIAHGGTIFLDEINSISPKMQSKLLRVLQEKEIMRLGSDYIIPLDVRIMVAANEELANKVLRNEFRRDLFYRLNVLELKIPPLRDRKKDIILLFKHFVKELTGETVKISKELEEKLKNHIWLGNVRELRNIAERYSLLKDKYNYDKILSFQETEKDKNLEIDGDMKIDLNEINKVVEDLVIQTLINKGFGKNEIANLLGISRTALWKKMNR